MARAIPVLCAAVAHLKAAVGGVAGFGKASAEKQANMVQDGKPEPVSNGTIPETGKPEVGSEEKQTEVVESIGAGGGI